jgi:hypothetical protein
MNLHNYLQMKKFTFIFLILIPSFVFSQNLKFSKKHRLPLDNEIPVEKAGSYGIQGAAYILVNDITSPQSAVFLGKDVTLDLNGYSITYADGNYQHVLNYGFEKGLAGWDISKAPGAKIESTKIHAFIGEKILRLKAGDEITSGYVNLPVAGRSYFAMCGVTGNYYSDMKGDLKNDMRVSIFIEDENGKQITCTSRYRDTTMISCPAINRSARLGGGFVFAHLNNIPAGRYRIRVRAENDCLVDEIDIRPAMDAGIGIVEETHPFGHYDHLYNNMHSAFFDYTKDAKAGEPAKNIPVVKGSGIVTIRNGMIVNGTEGILSWGIQSTAENVRIILDNVKIVTSGINTTAVDVEQATISHCIFDVKNPFIINRHGSEFYAVDIRGNQPSEVSDCDFYGGQGCLSIKGRNSSIHNNFFANRQTVTNHYSIMAMGDSSKIFDNKFEPEIGSGIEIFRNKFIEIFNNEFHISAAQPSCEYNDHLSTNAIRIADYGAAPGASNGCFGNRIYNNTFYITGRYYPEYPDFIPLASAIFYSASAGDNEISGNNIIINQLNPGTKAEAFAFYIGNARGGKLHDNKIITNVTPVWVACTYGKAENITLSNNLIEKAPGTLTAIQAVRMGSDYVAEGIEFRSNECKGMEFSVEATDRPHVYSVYQTLKINFRNKENKQVKQTEIFIWDTKGNHIPCMNNINNGVLIIELPEYSMNGKERTDYSPYTITAGKEQIKVELKENTEITMVMN